MCNHSCKVRVQILFEHIWFLYQFGLSVSVSKLRNTRKKWKKLRKNKPGAIYIGKEMGLIVKREVQKTICFVVFICFSFSQKFAYSAFSPTPVPTIILIRSNETSLTEFSAYAKTKSIKTYAEYQLEQNRKMPRPVVLKSLLKQAQIDFLSYEPERSKKSFRRITEYIHAFDWNEEERKIIFYSLFRLAQLEKDSQKQRLFLQEALVFGMDLRLDLQVFPPPLVNIYLHLKTQASFVSLNLKKLFPWHEIVLVNGKVYSNKERVTLPYGMYRVSAFSSSHKSRTQILSLSQLVLKALKTEPLVSGSCQKPVFNPVSELKKHHTHILFPNFCIWNSLKEQVANTKESILPADINKMEEDLEEPQKQSKWGEEEWLLLGVAVLAVGVTTVLILNGDDKTEESKKSKKIKPIVKIGF